MKTFKRKREILAWSDFVDWREDCAKMAEQGRRIKTFEQWLRKKKQ